MNFKLSDGAIRNVVATPRRAPKGWAKPISAYLTAFAHLSPRTLRIRDYHLRRLAHETGKPTPWQVEPIDILDTFAKNAHWADETYSAFRGSCRAFYQWAHDMELTARNPAAKIPARKVRHGRPTPVDDDAYQAALANADGRGRIALRLAGELGLRRAEVAVVHTDDLTETPHGWLLTVHGKGGKDRIVPLPANIADELIARIAGQGGGYAFPGPTEGHISPHWLGTLVTRLLPPEYSMHKLRHRALTRAYAQSKDLLLTATLAGHSNIAITQKYYVQPDQTALRTLVEGLAA